MTLKEFPYEPINSDAQPWFCHRPSQFRELFCIYRQTLPNPQFGPEVEMWIGVIKLVDLFTFNDARRNSEWVKYIGNHDQAGSTFVMGYGGYVACMNERAKLVQKYKPHCNMYGHDVSANMRVRCRETDEHFPTVSAAAKHFCASQSAMSNHLNAKPGYKSIKGHTFERVP